MCASTYTLPPAVFFGFAGGRRTSYPRLNVSAGRAAASACLSPSFRDPWYGVAGSTMNTLLMDHLVRPSIRFCVLSSSMRRSAVAGGGGVPARARTRNENALLCS